MARHRKSLLNAFKAAQVVRPEVTRAPAPAPVRAAPKPVEVRADEAIPVRPAPPLAPPRPAPRRTATHSDLPAPPPPLSRRRLLLLSIVGAAILLVVVLVMKFTHSSDGVAAAPDLGETKPAATTARPTERAATHRPWM